MAKRTRHYCHSCDAPAAYILPVEDGEELGLCAQCFDDLLTRLESARETFDEVEPQPRHSLLEPLCILAAYVAGIGLIVLLCWMF